MTGSGGTSGSSRLASWWTEAKLPTSLLSLACRVVAVAGWGDKGFSYQDRWNLLRMKMATALSPRIMTSSTMIAADAATRNSS